MTAVRSGLVAVLFTDLVGSTELMSKLGERQFDEVRRDHFSSLGRAVSAHGGEEVKNTGDGILAVFGSAGEAVEAAVAMQQATVRPRGAVRLSVRVGVAVGDATLEDGDVFGTPVVEAARLVAEARPGQILATAVVRTLAGRSLAEFAELGDLDLKGFPEPIPACQVKWEPLPLSSVPLPPLLTDRGRIFVGREHELERLGQLWKEAAAGERRVALLAGEPGVGKTRLAAELAAGVYEEGAVVLAGRCDEGLGVPYQPLVEALHHYVLHAADPCVGRYGGELARLVPEITGAVPGLAPPLRSDPETERYRLFDAVAAWLAAVSAEGPVLLVLDDLQWAAKPTLLLLRHVIRFEAPLHLLVVATYRDDEVGRDHPLFETLADLRRWGGVDTVALGGWDEPAVAAFIDAATGHSLSEEEVALPRAVWAQTEGNPLFVAEVLRHLRETGGVAYQDGRWMVTGPVDELGVPPSVRDVVGRRLARLSAAANQVLGVASVVGLEFEAALTRATGAFSEEAMVSALEEAVSARLLREVPGATPRYRFSHALVRAAIHDELIAARRVVFHRRAAEAIERLYATHLDDYLPRLARHWAHAAETPDGILRAVDYTTRAGDRALAQLAHDEAVAYYGQARELLDAADGDHDQRRLDLLIRLGEAQRRAGQAAYRGTLLEASRRARRLGDAERLVRAVLANSRGVHSAAGTVDRERVAALEAAVEVLGPQDRPERARVLATLASELTFSGEWERRRRLSDEAVAVARRSGDDATLARVLNMRGFVIQVPETARQRLAETTEALEVAERLGDPLERYFALWMRRQVTVELCDFAEADRVLAEQEHLARELGQPTLRWYAMAHRAWGEAFAGRLDAAECLADEALQLGREIGDPDAAAVHVAHLFMIRFDQGRLDELETQLNRGVTANPGLPVFRALLALTHCELGHPDEARRLVARDAATRLSEVPYDFTWGACLAASAYVTRHLGDIDAAERLYEMLAPTSGLLAYSVVFALGAMDHHLATLAATLSRFEIAEPHFADAEDTHRRIGAPSWLARTRLEWARMLLTRRQSGDQERARELLGQALATARELGLANVERQAAELLR